MLRRLPATALLILTLAVSACSPAAQDNLSRARAEAAEAEAAEAKAALAKLQAAVAKQTGGQTPGGQFALDRLDNTRKLFAGVYGDGFKVGMGYLFRYNGRGVPQCRVVDEKGQAVVGPVPSDGEVKDVIAGNRQNKDHPDPVNEGYIALVFAEGKARLVVVLDPDSSAPDAKGGHGLTARRGGVPLEGPEGDQSQHRDVHEQAEHLRHGRRCSTTGG